MCNILKMKLEKSQQFMLPTSQCDDDAGEVTKLEVTKNLAKKIVASGLQNDAFLLANEDQLMKNCGQLTKYFSEIQPYFGKKLDRSPAFLSSDDFKRSNEIIRTKWPIYVVISHFVLTI